jgi:hypothetical protein
MFLKVSFEPKMHSEDFDGLAELVSSFRRLLRLMCEELSNRDEFRQATFGPSFQ